LSNDSVLDKEALRAQLKEHEGVRLKPYRDTVGKLTIGVGRNLDDRGISMAEAEFLLDNDIEDHTKELFEKAPWVKRLDPTRQAVLVDMAFNLGVAGLLAFRRTLTSVQIGDYKLASLQMLASKWARQVKSRAFTLSKMMRTGINPFKESQ
jgi:lysozyme